MRCSRRQESQPPSGEDTGCGGDDPVLAGQYLQRGQQFGHVQVHLPRHGVELGEAEVDNRRPSAVTTTTAAARQATCTRPVMTRPTVPRPPGTGAAGPRSHRNAAAEAANAPASRRPAEIRRDQPDHVARVTVAGGRQ
jgi:hypothetical protein